MLRGSYQKKRSKRTAFPSAHALNLSKFLLSAVSVFLSIAKYANTTKSKFLKYKFRKRKKFIVNKWDVLLKVIKWVRIRSK